MAKRQSDRKANNKLATESRQETRTNSRTGAIDPATPQAQELYKRKSDRQAEKAANAKTLNDRRAAETSAWKSARAAAKKAVNDKVPRSIDDIKDGIGGTGRVT